MKTREIQKEALACSQEFPVVSIYGPRQSGKTTLARMCFPDKPWLSFESPDILKRAREDPRGLLQGFGREGAILDEIQCAPEILSYLQEEVDRDGTPGRFILTGSHQVSLKRGVAQSLAGRTAVLTLLPFTSEEILQDDPARRPDVFDLIFRGSYPRLHEQGIRPSRFYASYVATYLEKDLPSLLEVRNRKSFSDFLFLLGSRVGKLFNASGFANDIGVSGPTISAWISALEESNLVLILRPWFRNATCQVTKSSRVYFTDTGLAAWLARYTRKEDVEGGMIRGELYENHVILEILKHLLNRGETPDLSFYRDKNGREVDLIVNRHGAATPVEIKSAATFSTSFTDGIQFFRSTFPNCRPGVVVYNGDDTLPPYKDVTLANPLSSGWKNKILTLYQ